MVPNPADRHDAATTDGDQPRADAAAVGSLDAADVDPQVFGAALVALVTAAHENGVDVAGGYETRLEREPFDYEVVITRIGGP